MEQVIMHFAGFVLVAVLGWLASEVISHGKILVRIEGKIDRIPCLIKGHCSPEGGD